MNKKIIKKLFVCFAVALSFLPVFAEDDLANEQIITVEDAVKLALENNIQIKQQKIALDVAETANKYSWSSVSPTISASGSLSIPLMENAMGSKDPSFSVGGSVNFRLTPSLYTTIKSAKISYEQGQMTYDEAVRTVELNVRKSFYNILLAEENLSLQKRNLETTKTRYEMNLERYNQGRLSEIDLLSSQVSYESMKPNIESSESNLMNSVESFKLTLGIPLETPIKLSGDISDFIKIDESKIEAKIDEMPSIKSIEKQIEAAENSLLATRFSAWGPTLSAGYQISAGQTLNGKSKFDLTNHSISLSVSIPLDGYLPWSSGAQSIANQKANIEKLKLNLESEKANARITIESNIRKITQAKSQMDSLQATADLAQKTYDLTLTAYNHGSKDLLSLQNASDSVMSAKTNLQSQNYQLISAVLDLEKTLGLPFGSLIE